MTDRFDELFEAAPHHRLRNCFELDYQPPYSWQTEFHNAGATFPRRAILAANRVGKTRCIGQEVAIHLTGWYPQGWAGKMFSRPIDACVVARTNEDLRNIVQKELFGEFADGKRTPDGTGWVPANSLGRCTFRNCGVADVIDTIKVRHASGGWSKVMCKSYMQGALHFQGFAIDLGWLDEEPEDEDIVPEFMTRLMDRRGILLFSNTPLLGMSEIVRMFLERKPGTWYVNVGWDQAPHLTEKDRQEYLATYPEHQRKTRTTGTPLMGTGAVYPVEDSEIACDPFPIPDHYRQIVGVDFGIDHHGAAARIAYDADMDVVYVVDCYRKRDWVPLQHAARINAWGKWIPVSWPHDGMIRDKAGGKPIADQYRAHDVNMVEVPACYSEDKLGGQPREPVTLQILERMRTGRFRVFRGLSEWFEEKRMLHRKDGKIVPKNDDLESATRYAVMMLRYATSAKESQVKRPAVVEQTSYDPFAMLQAR